MNINVRSVDRFEGYTEEDCSCIYCLHYAGKGKPCRSPECCCEQERTEAIERETVRKPSVLEIPIGR